MYEINSSHLHVTLWSCYLGICSIMSVFIQLKLLNLPFYQVTVKCCACLSFLSPFDILPICQFKEIKRIHVYLILTLLFVYREQWKQDSISYLRWYCLLFCRRNRCMVSSVSLIFRLDVWFFSVSETVLP